MPGSLGWGPGVETWYPSEALIPWAKHPTFHMWLIAIQVTPVFGGNHVSQEKKVYKIKKSLFEIWPSKLDVAIVIKCNLPIGVRGYLCILSFHSIKKKFRDFPVGPEVKASPSNTGSASSIPGQGAKEPTFLVAPKLKHKKQYCKGFNKDLRKYSFKKIQ